MKKKTTTAILLAATMMLALMGCGAASTDTDSSSDAASVAEVNTDTNTTDDTSKETDADTDTSSDSASTDSSTSGTATASTDDSFTYKDKTFSILDDLPTTLDKINAVGTIVPDTPVEIDTGSKLYDYDVNGSDSDFTIVTFTDNGKESVGQISLMGPNAKTSKGICVGNSLKELTSAYGEPTSKTGNGYFYNYKFDNYVLSFDTMDDKVYVIYYYNLDYYNSRRR